MSKNDNPQMAIPQDAVQSVQTYNTPDVPCPCCHFLTWRTQEALICQPRIRTVSERAVCIKMPGPVS